MILVTGGTGYIGSHTVVELLNTNFKMLIVDNLSNSEEFVIAIKRLIEKKTSQTLNFSILEPAKEFLY